MNGQRTPEQDPGRRTGGPLVVLGRERPSPQQLEAAAREEFNSRAGRRLSDEEWAATRIGLIAFMRILRGCEQRKIDERNGKVMGMTEDYPQAA
jgi:hypothetical protein